MVAQRHPVHEIVEPGPFGAGVLVGPNGIVQVHHVAAVEDKHVLSVHLLKQTDGFGNAASLRFPFGKVGQGMAVIVAQMIDFNRDRS